MIELLNLSKQYSKGGFLSHKKIFRGVENISLSIPNGAFGLLGINGAGKTTTLKMIATLLRPSSGKILINGLDTVTHEKKIRRQINMITGSDRMLYYRLTGKENLLYFASLYGITYRDAISKINFLMNLTGMEYAQNKRVEEYSRGMKQRLSIARGLINDPKILLLDEPTLGLDASIAFEIRSFIKDELLNTEDRTIILTSHYMTEIEQICNQIGILQEGELIFHGGFKSLYNKLGMEDIHRFIIPFKYSTLKPDIDNLFTVKPSWINQKGGDLELTLSANDGFLLLKNLDKFKINGLSYSLEKPKLEEAVIHLSKVGI